MKLDPLFPNSLFTAHCAKKAFCQWRLEHKSQRVICLFEVILRMEGSERPGEVFRRPSEPGPSLQVSESARGQHQHGGQRRGSGRKRIYEAGYENVRSLACKTISIHTDIYEDWIREKQRHGFKDHSSFAKCLLEFAMNCTAALSNTTSSKTATSIGNICPVIRTAGMRISLHSYIIIYRLIYFSFPVL